MSPRIHGALLGALLGATLVLAGCTTTEPDAEVHCFNQSQGLTLPSFVSTKCPVVNPEPA